MSQRNAEPIITPSCGLPLHYNLTVPLSFHNDKQGPDLIYLPRLWEQSEGGHLGFEALTFQKFSFFRNDDFCWNDHSQKIIGSGWLKSHDSWVINDSRNYMSHDSRLMIHYSWFMFLTHDSWLMDILAFRTSTNSFDEIKMKTTHNYYTCVAASLPQVKTLNFLRFLL